MGTVLSAEKKACIIDCGSLTVKYGFNDQLLPSYENLSVIDDNQRISVNGEITNWHYTQKLYEYIFNNELLINPKCLNILIAQNSSFTNAKSYISNHLQIMFEGYNVNGFTCIDKDILNLYSKGLSTGVSLQSGYEITSIKAIFEGQIITDSIKRINYGGKHITMCLRQLLSQKHPYLTDMGIIRDIKEKLSYIPIHYESEDKQCDKSIYKLPDGKNICVSNELFKCTELMFQDEKICKKLVDTVNLYNNMNNSIHSKVVMLSGGNTLIDGFMDRLEFELQTLNINKTIKIYSAQTRKYNTWIGGSVITTLSSFESEWITKFEYEEYGESIIDRKCVNSVEGISTNIDNNISTYTKLDTNSGSDGLRIIEGNNSDGDMDNKIYCECENDTQYLHSISMKDKCMP